MKHYITLVLKSRHCPFGGNGSAARGSIIISTDLADDRELELPIFNNVSFPIVDHNDQQLLAHLLSISTKTAISEDKIRTMNVDFLSQNYWGTILDRDDQELVVQLSKHFNTKILETGIFETDLFSKCHF